MILSRSPVRTKNAHRRLHRAGIALADILWKRKVSHASQQLSFAFDRKQIILERSELADKLADQCVEVYDFADRSLQACGVCRQIIEKHCGTIKVRSRTHDGHGTKFVIVLPE